MIFVVTVLSLLFAIAITVFLATRTPLPSTMTVVDASGHPVANVLVFVDWKLGGDVVSKSWVNSDAHGVLDLTKTKSTVWSLIAEPWDEQLEAIAAKMNKVKSKARMLKIKHKNHDNHDGSMSRKAQRAYIEEYRAKVVGAANTATYKRGASNGGYHYLGCAKTMAGIGQAFAEAVLEMQR